MGRRRHWSATHPVVIQHVQAGGCGHVHAADEPDGCFGLQSPEVLQNGPSLPWDNPVVNDEPGDDGQAHADDQGTPPWDLLDGTAQEDTETVDEYTDGIENGKTSQAYNETTDIDNPRRS